jgi:hypothetical protein
MIHCRFLAQIINHLHKYWNVILFYIVVSGTALGVPFNNREIPT